MARLKGDGKTVLLSPERRIDILELLAKGGKTLIEIAEIYHTSEKEISRVRDQALKFSPRWRNERSARVQKYLIFCEEKHANRRTHKRVAPGNDTNRTIVNNESQLEEKSSKAKIYAQKLEDHYKVLSDKAIDIADVLHYFELCSGEKTLEQILDNDYKGWQPQDECAEQYQEYLDLLQNTEASWLLSHIKSEAPELFIHFMYAHPEFFTPETQKKPQSEHIDRWEDMTEDDCGTYGRILVNLLKTRAAQKEFPGTCEVCKGWK